MAANVNPDYYRPEKNRELVLRLFYFHYRVHVHSGGIYEATPDFFLVNPEVLDTMDIASRAADRQMIQECARRAASRSGHVAVVKRYNPKLNYYWLELMVMPFVLGDAVTEHNEKCLYFVLSHFAEHASQTPALYGDLAAELKSDKDLALMLKEIDRRSKEMCSWANIYPDDQLVRFDRDWPLAEVHRLLAILGNNSPGWCELFSETVSYMMQHRARF